MLGNKGARWLPPASIHDRETGPSSGLSLPVGQAGRFILARSSMVECLILNQVVAGSSPAGPIKKGIEMITGVTIVFDPDKQEEVEALIDFIAKNKGISWVSWIDIIAQRDLQTEVAAAKISQERNREK